MNNISTFTGINSSLLAFFLTFFVLILLRKISFYIGLVDIPNSRKTHTSKIPLIGGIAIFLGVFFSLLILQRISDYDNLFYMLGGLVLLGSLDDFMDLSYFFKFFCEILLCSLFVIFNEFYINNFLNLEAYILYELFTIIFMVALINSINMLDGIDGLAGGFTVIVFFLIGIISLACHFYENILLIYLFGGALASFLLFNIRFPWRCNALVFLGDAGSILLGFMLAWLSISLSHKVNFINILWSLALPLWDMTRIVIVRLLSGKHPMKADCQHLHHLLQSKGFSVSQTLFIILSITVISSGIGISGWFYEIPIQLMWFSFLMLFFLYCYIVNYLTKKTLDNF
ncbi:MAG: MraY family glycosyltransferase [Candidatus Parabeggiatoa sp.]|nr:MraY family glycosyltransferase [Candidatus Parabeggiatoa sp.]